MVAAEACGAAQGAAAAAVRLLIFTAKDSPELAVFKHLPEHLRRT